ncbi:unnamed protein product [Linum trigynum]|uniref:Myb/SANT-like domain-containing protein n=2 Tax=Linum trigynum TaxID=586398 RepID=A0AAV2F226_9ROSI
MVKRKQRDEDMDGASSKTYTYWKEELDKPFVDCIMELVEKGQIVDDNCKNGAYKQLEKLLQERVPGCRVKAYPNIEGRFKKLKKRWHAITFMRKQSGWGWDEVNKCIVCPEGSWDEFEKKHTSCRGLNKKRFPVYDDLAPVFCKGRASGEHGVDTNVVDSIDLEDEETAPVENEEMDDVLMEEIQAEMAAQNNQSASVTASTDGAPIKKRKKGKTVDEHLANSTEEMRELRPLIKQSVDTIARALGESDDLISKRSNLLRKLEELGGLTTTDIITALRKLSNNDRDLVTFYSLEADEYKMAFVRGLLG